MTIMHQTTSFLCILCLCPMLMCETPPMKAKASFESLYRSGVDAYLQNKWYECIAFIEKSLEGYFYYRYVIIQCRSYCHNQTSAVNDDRSSFFTSAIKHALCLTKCDQSFFEDRPRISKDIAEEFEKRTPYNYLQLCYFKAENIEIAASYAFTFLIHNPNHEVMSKNLMYYIENTNLEKRNIRSMEVQEYQELYLHAAHAYELQMFEDVVILMEKALNQYLVAEEHCRLMCEGPMEGANNEELYISIANHFAYTLRCKLGCADKLSYIYGQKHSNLLSSHYHYLQFSYYKSNRPMEACQSVASYLLLHPNDKMMKKNHIFYSKQEGFKQEWLTPRKEAIKFYKRWEEESTLMKNIDRQFELRKTEFQESNQQFLAPPPVAPSLVRPTHYSNEENGYKAVEDNWLAKNGIVLHFKDKELNGTKRVSFHGLAAEKECEVLIDLASKGALHGDGYNWRESPHTKFEMFDGLAITRAILMAQRGLLDPIAVQSFLSISDKGRQAVETYFNLTSELYFSYTHLVCRTAVPSSPDERSDLSHPIHADNCMLLQDGECLKKRPAYVWRDYSAIIYLNEDFEGGEFIFAKDKNTVQASLKPKCGMMVAFSAGKENLHGVKAVKKGRRCALAMWYTLNAQYKEHERDFAKQILTSVLEKRELLNGKAANANFVESRINWFLGVRGTVNVQNGPAHASEHVHSEL